jgi:TnpA family transposase
VVIAHLAKQLGIAAPSCLARYRARAETHHAHAAEIQRRYGYRDFHQQPEHFRLVRWLYTRAWVSAERPIALFDLTTARLVKQKILLPGVTTLTRLVASVRDRAAGRLWRILAALPSPLQRGRLLSLLQAAEDSHRYSLLDRLRRAPTRISAAGMLDALDRLSEFRALRVEDLDLAHVPPGRLHTLARYAALSKAQAIQRMPDERQIATLLAFARVYESVAQDDAVDLLHQFIGTKLLRAEHIGERERLRTLRDLDASALRMRETCLIILDPLYADAELRTAIFARVPREQLEKDVATVATLSREDNDNYFEHLSNHDGQVRRFLPRLLKEIRFEANRAGQSVLEALEFLSRCEENSKTILQDVPRGVLTRPWRQLVERPDGGLDRKFYTFCVLERLHDGLHRRDVFLTRSERWADPRAKLLQGQAWEAARPSVCRTLGRELSAEREIQALAKQLDEAFRHTAAMLPSHEDLRIRQINGKDRLSLTSLDKLDEPPSLLKLKDQVDSLLPRVDLPDAILEIHALTGFADEFIHISEGRGRVEDLALSICAVLVAEACNIGLEPLVRPEIPALTAARLAWVQQNYIRAETLIRANARLVKAQAHIPLTKAWGGGEVASADGLRFVVPVRTLHAGYNSKYFHVERGVTYYNFTSDQFSGFHGIVIPGTLHDSPYVLDGLLEHQTELQPRQLMTDSAGYSDIVFGLFWLLGFQFSPRLAELGEARFRRIDPKANYGVLNGLARHRVNTALIIQHWDDLLRIAGSLKMGTVRASELIRSLQRGGRASSLGRAIGELGRIPKSLHLLNFIADSNYRRHILNQLNRGEGPGRLSRNVFYGQRGELRQRYREGQEDQLSALGLVVNALILWTTRYMNAALNHLHATGANVKQEDLARLSPLSHKHFNMLGRYHFAVPEEVLRGGGLW